MKEFDFEMIMEVRDYECDLQGIVNNSVYQNYLEHARHKFLQNADLDFAELHEQGVDAVVIKAELEYKFPLRPNDEFFVRIKLKRQGRLRIIFDQQIIRKADEKLIVNARITAVLTKGGRPLSPDILVEKFEKAGVRVEDI